MNIKISIITVNYNDKAGLEKTIESVASQTFKDFEFIVIDGNSTDGSRELLEKNAAIFTYWSSEPDKGIYQAMNKGIRIAKGEYLLFLNSGDSLYDNDVLKKIDAEIDDSCGIYYGDIIYNGLGEQTKKVFPEKLTFGFFYEHNISHQASFIKRSLFEELFLYNEDFKIASDWEFFMYAICKENIPYKHLDLIVTTYDGTGISSNIDNHKEMNKEREISIKKYFPAFYTDYTYLSQLKHKRVRQFFFIKTHPAAWGILKICMNVILLFFPGYKRKHYGPS